MTTLHIVPHTHWDREWYLGFQESRIRLVHLIDLLLGILDRDPDYAHFTLDGQTIVVDDYLEIRPERRSEIARHIREGRLLIGPWRVLPDEFIVSPESIVRNLEQGSRSSREIGGPNGRMDVGYVPDPFGHIGQLPQILRGFGIETTAFRRGLGDDPVELIWEAPDGSNVLASYLRDGYGNAMRLPTRPGSFSTVVRSLDASLAPHSAVSHRLLLNGTDHHEPQAEIAALIRDAETGPDSWILSTLPAYFDAVRQEVEETGIDLEVRRGELRDPEKHHLLPGVMSSRTWIKQRNDACERLLERWAEPMSAWAEPLCADRPDRPVWTGQLTLPRVRGARALIDHAWGLLLECHPHDSICGCSIDIVHDEMRSRFDQAEQIGEEITRQALVALAEEIDTRPLASHEAVQAVIAFNPAMTKRSELVTASLELNGGFESFELIDEDGRSLPHRIRHRRESELVKLRFAPDGLGRLTRGIADGRILTLAVQRVSVIRRDAVLAIDVIVSEGGEPRMDRVQNALREIEIQLERGGLEGVQVYIGYAPVVDLELLVRDMPPHGYRSLGLRTASTSPEEPRRDEERRIANEILQVEVAPDGTVTLEDLRNETVFAGLLGLRDRGERGDSYTTDPLGDDVTRVSEIRIQRTIDACEQRLEVRGILTLPARLSPDRKTRCDETVDLPLVMRLSLVPGVPRVDVSIEIENRALDHRLEVILPTGQALTSALYDGHFEIVRRPTSVPEGGPDWEEQPRPEMPMQGFVSAGGLCVATHGIREASVSSQGAIAITLLRCFGWLSRDDLSTRRSGAGPHLETPGGQSPGPQRFELSVIPVAGDETAARLQADAYQTRPRAVGTGIRSGRLPGRASLLEIGPAEFRLSAVREAQEGRAIVVRGVYLGTTEGEIVIRPHVAPSSASRVRLDEKGIESVQPDPDGTLRLMARPNEIVSLRLEY